MDFRERVVLVTGAASGIGRALCRQLGAAGARLGLVDRDEAGLERFRSELETAGVRTALAVADVRKREEVRSAVALLTERLGPVDVLIPCAGICGFEVVDDLNVPQVEKPPCRAGTSLPPFPSLLGAIDGTGAGNARFPVISELSWESGRTRSSSGFAAWGRVTLAWARGRASAAPAGAIASVFSENCSFPLSGARE